MNYTELKEKYTAKSKTDRGSNADVPPVLILRRIGIRPFPYGQRVALYRNKLLNLTFSVPYTLGSKKDKDTAVISGKIDENNKHLTELDNLRRLEYVATKNVVKEFHFEDGSKTRVDPTTAKYIRMLYDKLTTRNRRKVANKLNTSSGDFHTIGKFAFRNLKD